MDSKVNFGNIVHILSLIKEGKTFNLDDFASRVNLSLDKLLYSLTILSEVYSAEGNSFVDFEVNNEKNLITFDFDNDLLAIQTITDLDLFKIYTILINLIENLKNYLFNLCKCPSIYTSVVSPNLSITRATVSPALRFITLLLSK